MKLLIFKFAGKDISWCECLMFVFCSAATPNVSIKAEMVERGGSEFWVVSCVSSGGRPDTNISLVLNSDEEPQRDDQKALDKQMSLYFLPAAAYEGQNITCVFGHPKFTHPVSKVTTLPSFCEYLWVVSFHLVERWDTMRTCSPLVSDVSGVQWFRSGLGNSSSDLQDSGSVELHEGQNDVAIDLRVSGNVPRYNVSCSRREKRHSVLFLLL